MLGHHLPISTYRRKKYNPYITNKRKGRKKANECKEWVYHNLLTLQPPFFFKGIIVATRAGNPSVGITNWQASGDWLAFSPYRLAGYRTLAESSAVTEEGGGGTETAVVVVRKYPVVTFNRRGDDGRGWWIKHQSEGWAVSLQGDDWSAGKASGWVVERALMTSDGLSDIVIGWGLPSDEHQRWRRFDFVCVCKFTTLLHCVCDTCEKSSSSWTTIPNLP